MFLSPFFSSRSFSPLSPLLLFSFDNKPAPFVLNVSFKEKLDMTLNPMYFAIVCDFWQEVPRYWEFWKESIVAETVYGIADKRIVKRNWVWNTSYWRTGSRMREKLQILWWRSRRDGVQGWVGVFEARFVEVMLNGGLFWKTVSSVIMKAMLNAFHPTVATSCLNKKTHPTTMRYIWKMMNNIRSPRLARQDIVSGKVTWESQLHMQNKEDEERKRRCIKWKITGRNFNIRVWRFSDFPIEISVFPGIYR